MLKVIVMCLVIVLAGWVLSNPITYFRKECPTTRLYSEGTREVLKSAGPLSVPVDPSQGILRGLDQGHVPFRVR
jgi:hypothetical protein